MDTPLAPAPAVITTPAPSASGPQAEVTEAEAAKMSGWIKDDLAKGKITQAQADQAFAELNTPMEQRGPDMRTEERKMLDKHFPAAQPRDYTIRYGDPGQEPTMTLELKQFDSNARTWMSTAGMPRELGNSLVSTIAKVAQQTQHMTADELETYGHREFEKLQKVHGPALDEKLQAAAQMVHDLDLKTPGLKNLLKSKGIGDSALVASMLIQQAEVFWARRR